MSESLCDMSNEEWLRRVLAFPTEEEDLIDFIYETIDNAHEGSGTRVDELLAWLAPSALPTIAILAVLSISRTPSGYGIRTGCKQPVLPSLQAFAAKAAARVRETDPTEADDLLSGLVPG